MRNSKQLAAFLLLYIIVAGSLQLNAQEKSPNFLFIIADDQSPYDLKIYNPESELSTPNIDKLAAEGMVIDGSYHMGAWAGGVCTPSRHMIMSGRTVWHIPDKPGMMRNPLEKVPDMVPSDLAENTMAAIFNRAGYSTMRTCKRGNSYEAANQKFTVRHDAMKRAGDDKNGSAWHAEQVLNYLNDRESKEAVDPFLIYFGFSHPHDPRNGKEGLLEKYGATNHEDINSLPQLNQKQPALSSNYLPEHPFHHGHPGLRDEVKAPGVWKNRDEATIRNEMGREFACSENIDIQIGRVLDKLEEMGELDNTYIIYTADHGIAIGKHGLQGKQNLYEHSWRVPFIVKGPGVKHGRAQGNIYLLDVLGTLCDLAGIEAPETVESISFKPVIEGKQETVRAVLYGVYSGGTKPGMRSVRKGDWKLIKYDVMDGTVRENQLFNMKDNPDELLKEHHDPKVVALTGNIPNQNEVNLADDPKYADKLAEMEALLLSEMEAHDDPYRLWNQPPLDKELKDEPSRESLSKAAMAKDDDSRPNIILIMADDLGWGDTGYNEHERIKTPNLDKMAEEGVQFNRFYAAAPVCSPTRGSVLTGRNPYRYGITSANVSHLLEEEINLAELLTEEGYATGLFGKWHLGTLFPDFSGKRIKLHKPEENFMTPGMAGFEEWCATEASIPTYNPYAKREANAYDDGKQYNYDRRQLYVENGIVLQEDLLGCDSKIIMDKAIPFIDNAVKENKPFFTVIWFHAPHGPVEGHPEYMKSLYSDLPLEKQHYYSVVTALDAQVGELRNKLRELGVEDNTMICFTSDNGPEGNPGPVKRYQGSAGDFRGRKRSLYEGGIRVPGIIEWPAVIKDHIEVDIPVVTSDYFPTICEILGLKLKDNRPIDGISLMNILKGAQTMRGVSIGFQFKNQNQKAIVGDRYKLVQNTGVKRSGADNRDFPRSEYELYDIISDPFETNDISTKHDDVLDKMKAELLSFLTSCEESNQGRDYSD